MMSLKNHSITTVVYVLIIATLLLLSKCSAKPPKRVTAKKTLDQAAVPQPYRPGRNEGPQAPLLGAGNVDGSKIKTRRENMCFKLNAALRKKDLALIKLDRVKQSLLTQVNKDKKRAVNADLEAERSSDDSNSELAAAQSEILSLFMKQLDLNEQLIYTTIDWLDQSLAGKYNEISSMKLYMENRLKAFRDAAYTEEQDYHQLIEAEKEFNRTKNEKPISGIVGQVLSEVSDAADNLEEDLGDHIFEKAANDKVARGDNIETVVRLKLEEDDDMVYRLVDSNNNQFVLSRSQDTTVPHEDLSLLLDLVNIISMSTALSYISSILHLPLMFGQVVSGVILGPSVINLLNSLVQIETLAELGVFFIMFTVGLEFSPAHIMKVLVISFFSSTGLMLVMICGGLLVSLLLSASSLAEAAFIGACFSLSSTPLVVKLVSAQADTDKEDVDSSKVEYTEILLGILVLQDVLMGLLIAFLPALAGSKTILTSAGLVVQVILSLAAVLLLCVVLILVLQKMRHLLTRLSSEMLTLLSTAFVFTMLWITFKLGISMELGCFLAGSVISSAGNPLTNTVESLVNPIKDLFSCFFFTAIGLHVFPRFVLLELGTLLVSTAVVISFKFGASIIVIRFFLPLPKRHHSWLIAAGLSQVSEFSFVLSSRARQLGLISREVYLLILSLSTLSLVFSPIIWKLVAVTDRPTRLQRTISSSSATANDHIGILK